MALFAVFCYVSRVKRCFKCHAHKALTEFHKHKNSPDGVRSVCKPCRSEEAKAYNEKNRDKHIATSKAWVAKHQDRVKQNNANWHARNRDRRIVDARENYYRRNRDHPMSGMVDRARARAKLLGVPFDLSYDDIMIPNVCPVLGIPMFFRAGKKGPCMNSPSLDRFDPKGGYTKANVVVISHRANTLKNNATVDEIANVLAYMRSRPMTVECQLAACAAGEPTTPWDPSTLPAPVPRAPRKAKKPAPGQLSLLG